MATSGKRICSFVGLSKNDPSWKRRQQKHCRKSPGEKNIVFVYAHLQGEFSPQLEEQMINGWNWKAPSVENSRCSFGSLICFWETQENLSHLSRLLMNSYDLLAFTGFHRAGTTWVAENLFGHATPIWDPWFLPFVGHDHLLDLSSRGPSHFLAGGLDKFKMLMPFENVSSGSWLILVYPVYPKGLDRKPSDRVFVT